MAIPATAQTFAESMDPQEALDFVLGISGLLESGESAVDGDWTLEPLIEATALGLDLATGAGRDAHLVGGNAILFWPEIDDAFQDNAAFNGAGTALPLQVTFGTNSTPQRTRQRTVLLRVVQR